MIKIAGLHKSANDNERGEDCMDEGNTENNHENKLKEPENKETENSASEAPVVLQVSRPILRRRSAFGERIARRFVGRCMVVAVIFFLAYCDYRAMTILFEQGNVSTDDATLFSLIFAICLEGLPTLLGMFLSTLADQTNYLRNENIVAKIGVAVCATASLIVFALAVFLRIFYIYLHGGLDVFLDASKDYFYLDAEGYIVEGSRIADAFFIVSPILTSMLAFSASWWAFKPNSATELEEHVDRLHHDYLDAQEDFKDTLGKLHWLRETLWSELSAGEAQPKEYAAFRRAVFKRIRAKLIEQCISAYPNQIRSFNKKIEGRLDNYLDEICQRSKSRVVLIDLDVDDILKAFDEQDMEDSLPWDYDRAEDSLKEELIARLDNAVAVAQYKTAIHPYRMEGDGY